jgi:hypothetical protein
MNYPQPGFLRGVQVISLLHYGTGRVAPIRGVGLSHYSGTGYGVEES